MTTATTAQTTNWQDVPMRDRYSVGDFVAVHGSRGKVRRVVQIAKVTKTRYMATYTWLKPDGTMGISDRPTEYFMRHTGRAYHKHSSEYLDGTAYSAQGAFGVIAGIAQAESERRSTEYRDQVADAKRKFVAGRAMFGADGKRNVANVAPAGTNPMWQATFEIAIRNVPTKVMLLWHDSLSISRAPMDYFTWTLDFTAFTWDAGDNKWRGPATWNSYEMSGDAISEAAESVGMDAQAFVYTMLLGEALIRLAW